MRERENIKASSQEYPMGEVRSASVAFNMDTTYININIITASSNMEDEEADPNHLAEVEKEIASRSTMIPLLVIDKGDHFELHGKGAEYLCWRAAKNIGVRLVPCIIMNSVRIHKDKKLTPSDISSRISEHYKLYLHLEDTKTERQRKEELALKIETYILYEMSDMSLELIGSVTHQNPDSIPGIARAFRDEVESNEGMKTEITGIMRELQSYVP